MDKNARLVIEKRINRAIDALKKNNINGYYIKDNAELISKLLELIPQGSTIGSGGSVTLTETGVKEFIKSSNYNCIDADIQNVTMEEKKNIYRKAFFADVYVTSSNAVTMDGKLYNVDGIGNRVAAITFGPEKVIVVVGYNKLVENLQEAEYRLKNIAAPANVGRIGIEQTGCYHTGVCTNCHSDRRICCHYVITGFTRDKDKYHVLILPEVLGY